MLCNESHKQCLVRRYPVILVHEYKVMNSRSPNSPIGNNSVGASTGRTGGQSTGAFLKSTTLQILPFDT